MDHTPNCILSELSGFQKHLLFIDIYKEKKNFDIYEEKLLFST